MSYAGNSLFFGELNNITLSDINKQIDYKKTSYEERSKVVDDILETGFYDEYMENHFKTNINTNEALSEDEAGCSSLEKIATYLLNSDEVKEKKKETEYIFYSDESSFQDAVNREPNYDGMGDGNSRENVIHFLKKENRNYKKLKTQDITKKDLLRTDFLGDVLRDYQKMLDGITHDLKSKRKDVSRYLLTKNSGGIKNDMILAKDSLLGVFGYKTNASESTVIDWHLIDFTDKEHIEALLYFYPSYDGNEELKYIVEDFNKMLNKLFLTDIQKGIIKLLRKEKSITDIAKELDVTRKTIYKNKDAVVNRICEMAGSMKTSELY